LTDQYGVATPQQPYQPYSPTPWAPPVTGFVLALLIPIVGIFICHSEKRQAAEIGQDNALARAGFAISLVLCILIGCVIALYITIGVVAFTSFSNMSTSVS